MNDGDAPSVRITIEVPIHDKFPTYYAERQHDLIRTTVEEAIKALIEMGKLP